jgi:hypothetical protein
MRPKSLAFAALLAGAVAGLGALRKRGRPERVHLFYDGGPLVTLTGAEAEPFLEIARPVL